MLRLSHTFQLDGKSIDRPNDIQSSLPAAVGSIRPMRYDVTAFLSSSTLDRGSCPAIRIGPEEESSGWRPSGFRFHQRQPQHRPISGGRGEGANFDVRIRIELWSRL